MCSSILIAIVCQNVPVIVVPSPVNLLLAQVQYTEKDMERSERRSKRPSLISSPLPAANSIASSKDSQPPLRIANSLPSPSFFPGHGPDFGLADTEISPVTTIGMTSESTSASEGAELQRGVDTPSKVNNWGLHITDASPPSTEEERVRELVRVKEGSGRGKVERDDRDMKTKSADSNR